MTDQPALLEGRVLRTVGGSYQVETGEGMLECHLRGRIKQERDLGRVAVGDMVRVEVLSEESCVITEVLPRASKVSRRAPHGRREQVIAANVDRLAPVFSMAEPRPHLDLLDRLLVLAEANEIDAFLVVNKIDLSGIEEARQRFEPYARAGYETLYTSAETREGIDALREHLTSHVTIFVGPSGVGKSSLLNAIQPDLGLRVGEVSRALEGRHTTVAASLHPLEVGGYVVDTPGLRNLRFWEVGVERLDFCFPEFRPHLGTCRFPDCTHVHEPDCAVLAARENGEIPESRYASYVRLLQEREEDAGY